MAAVTDPTSTGVPFLVRPAGAQSLERVPLTLQGESEFDEAWLQRLIHEHPSCLPIAEIEPGLDQLVSICREMPTPRGYVDNLLMTGMGDIAIVETKLFRNPEARRKVLAQALDYATSLFNMSYEAFEEAALAGTFAPRLKPASLHAALPEADKLDEQAFVDAVTRNLRRGRALILIAGDGIRSDVESLLDGLHAYARFGFTLALVELGVFRMPEPGHYLVRPRTLAKTVIVQRTIVEITGHGAEVKEERLAVAETLSSDAYWQALEAKVPGTRGALETLIKSVEPLGVYPEFLKSLNLKWQRPDRKPVNLGYIYKNVSLWVDAAAWNVPKELAKRYVEDLAVAFDCDVHALPHGNSWTLYKNGKPLRLDALLDRLVRWPAVMRDFINAIQQYDAASG